MRPTLVLNGIETGCQSGGCQTKRRQTEDSDYNLSEIVVVEELSGKKRKLEVTPTDRASSLKRQICEECDIPPECQRLIYNGRELGGDGERERSLGSYRIRQGEVVRLILRLPPGRPCKGYAAQGSLSSGRA